MKVTLIIFFLFCYTFAFSQVNPGNSISNHIEISKPDSSNKSGFFNFFPGIFSSANGEIKLGSAFLLGLQFDVSQITSIGFDFNFGFSNEKKTDYTKQNTIIQFEAGPGFNFYKENKTIFFAAPKIGYSFMFTSKKFESFVYPAFCISLEAGLQQEIFKELSLTFKLRFNNMLAKKTDISNSILFLNGGISLKL